MDQDEPTPTRPSSTAATFRLAVEELTRGLDGLGLDREGMEIRHEAGELLTVMWSWPDHPPAHPEYREVIERAAALHRRGTDYLTRRRPAG